MNADDRTVDGVDARLVSLLAPDSFEAEQYRRLRNTVESLHKPGTGTVVGVCSALPGDGKTITAINLAGALAQDPTARVLLMEVDLHRPSVTVADHLALGNLGGGGLVDAVRQRELTLAQVVRPIPRFNLYVLPAGACPPAPYEILKSPRFGELIAAARRAFDYVILDTPPLLPVADCRLIARCVDGFLVVVAARQTPRAALEEALNILEPHSVLGLVFNGLDRSATRHYGYGYGYGHGYAYGPRADRARARP